MINNVETLSAAPEILRRGGEWYAGLGSPKNGGTRLFCISGHVNKPGIYELPMGFPLRQMIEDVAGGMLKRQRSWKAVIPGGNSCPLLAPRTKLTWRWTTIRWPRPDAMLGSGGLIVIDEDTCMVDLARRIMQFYAHESCGWCIPCREGTDWLFKMLDRFHSGGGRAEDIPLVGELAKNMLGKNVLPAGRRRRPCRPSVSSTSGAMNLNSIFPASVRYKPADVLAARYAEDSGRKWQIRKMSR